MANDLPTGIHDQTFAEVEGLGRATLVLADSVGRGNDVLHRARGVVTPTASGRVRSSSLEQTGAQPH